MGEIAAGVPPQGTKTCFVFFLLSRQRGLSATYLATISTISETADVNRFPHAYTGENFSNFYAGYFPRSKTAGTLEYRVFVIELQLKRNNSMGDGNHFGG